jgi:antitoxin component HigA of HigAB toxin-antitoxin module
MGIPGNFVYGVVILLDVILLFLWRRTRQSRQSKPSSVVQLKLVVPLLLALMLFVAVPSASASSVTTTHQTVRETVTWTLTPEQCSSVQAPLSGIGECFMVIITTVYADGSIRYLINDVVKGTASDSTGTYHFKYSNHSTEDVPAGGGAHQIHMTDSFVLNGKAQHHDITPPDPIEAILYHLESRGLSRRDLEAHLGSRARVSEILNRKRPLPLEMIRRLHAGLGIPAEVLIQPYRQPKAAA